MIDINLGVIKTEVDHFTKFAIFENKEIVTLEDMYHWSKKYVEKLLGLGIVNGIKTSSGRYIYNYYAKSLLLQLWDG